MSPRPENRRAWTEADDTRLRACFPAALTADVARELGRSYDATAQRARLLGVGKSAAYLASSGAGRFRAGRRTWSEADEVRLRALFPGTPTADVARELGHSYAATARRAAQLGLSKSDAYLAGAAAGRFRRGHSGSTRTQFRPGDAPANKGLRRPGWGPGRMKETQFRKGSLGGIAATRLMPIGSTRVAGGYLWRKVSALPGPWTRNWRQAHLLLWEEQHGRVPPGHALVFKNGDRTDVRLENLTLITRRELMARNTVHNLPAPLPQTIQLLGAITRKINRRTRDHEEQDRGPAQPPVLDAGGALGPREADGARPGACDRGCRARDRRLGEGGGRVHRGDGRPRRDGIHPAPGGGDAAAAAAGGRSVAVADHGASPSHPQQAGVA